MDVAYVNIMGTGDHSAPIALGSISLISSAEVTIGLLYTKEEF